MERPIIMLNRQYARILPRETSAQKIQNAQSTFQKPMSAAVHVQCGY